MRLRTFSDYSLRILLYVGLRQGTRVTIDEIAGAYGISKDHLMKVVVVLGRLDFLRTVRGRGGGLELGRPAAEISLGAVLRATESDRPVVECLGTQAGTCPLTGVCTMTDMFDEATEAFYRVFDRYTLQDALDRPHLLERRLRIPVT